jgi:predicted PurR-regulated permease PerM
MKKSIEWKVLVVLLVFFFLVSLYVVHPFLDALILSAFFAYMGHPLTNRIEGVVKNRGLAAILVVALAILPVVLISIQAMNLYTREVVRMEEVRYTLPYLGKVSLSSLFESGLEKVKSRVGPEGIVRGLSMGVELLLKVFLVLVGSYYLLRERFALKRLLISMAPPKREYLVAYFFTALNRIYYGIFFGHFITALFSGLIGAVGFYLIGSSQGVPFLHTYPIFLGALVAFFSLLPIVGPKLVYVPMGIALLLGGDYPTALIILAFGFLALNLFPDFAVRPFIAGRKGKTHPFIILLGFTSGPFVFGPLGIILGPALLGMFKATLDTYEEMILQEKR